MESLPEQRFIEVARGVTAVISGRGEAGVANTAFVVDQGEAVLLDTTLLPEWAEPVRREIRSRGARVRTVVNSHHHVDHVGGNAAFPEARVVAHRVSAAFVEDMVRERPPLERVIPRYASLVRTEELRVPEAMAEVVVDLPGDGRVLALGPAHTPMDLAIWLPGSRTLLAGDLCFKGVTPLAAHGDVAGWISALDTLLALRPAVVVPGHGPLATAADLVCLRGYLRAVRDAARAAVEDGTGPAEAARRLDPGPVGDWLEPERTVLNLQVTMARLVQAGRPAPAPTPAP